MESPRLHKPAPIEDPEATSIDSGIVLLDLSFRLLAADDGATAILQGFSQQFGEEEVISWLPMDDLIGLRDEAVTERTSRRVTFRCGGQLYSCRAYLVQSKLGLLPRTVLVLHLTREFQVYDALHTVARQYRLTDREEEALVGISTGLTNKEVADQMHISPNTVKAFTRLIMLKLGVNTRSGIVGRVLEYNDRLKNNKNYSSTHGG